MNTQTRAFGQEINAWVNRWAHGLLVNDKSECRPKGWVMCACDNE